MPAKVDLALAFKMPPREAVEYFRGKGYAITENWQDLWRDAHARAFTVAKAGKLSVLGDIRGALDKALARGTTEAEFVKTLKPRLQERGWWGRRADGRMLGSPRRLKTIFRTNMMSSYNAGRWREQERRAKLGAGARPYLQYVAVLDGRTRDSHRALHGKVFPVDSEFWNVWYPPNGFRCRCRVRALSAEQVRRKGLKVERKVELPEFEARVGVDRGTGEILHRKVRGYRGRDRAGKVVALHPHPGFDYNPGKRWPRWDPLGATPAARRIPGVGAQPTWEDYGLKRAELEDWGSAPFPLQVGEGATKEEALDILATAVLGKKSAKLRIVRTPVEDFPLKRDQLIHVANNRPARRERFARALLPSLEDPNEVWLVLRRGEGGKYFYRKRYIKVWAEEKKQFVSVVEEGADGGVFVTFVPNSKWTYIDNQRQGALLYRKEGA